MTKESVLIDAQGGTGVYEQLRDLIVAGQLAPGLALIETKLAERLGASRSRVRAALQRLMQEGYVRAEAAGKYSRMVVAPLTVADMKELFSIMGGLEAISGRLAADLDEEERLPLADEMDDINAALLAASDSYPPDVIRAQELHVRFHLEHSEVAAGPRLRTQISAVQPQTERYWRVYTTVLVHEMPTAAREHERIIAAIREGDPDAAEREILVNWRQGAKRYSEVIAVFGEHGSWWSETEEAARRPV